MTDLLHNLKRQGELSLLRLPLLWLFIGPPAFRNMEARAPTASMDGDNDVWNYVRLAWWLICGAYALLELMRASGSLPSFVRRLGALPFCVGVWLVMIYISVFVSPNPLYTLVMCVMMTILVLCSADAAFKVYWGAVSADRILRVLLLMSVALLALVLAIYHLNPSSNVVARAYFGDRVRGGTVAYAPLVSLITIFVSGYYLVQSRRPLVQLLTGAALLFGLYMLQLGQTRSAYVGLLLGIAVFVSYRWKLHRNVALMTAFGASVIIFFCLVAFAYDHSHSVRWRMDGYYDRYVLRDKYFVENPEHAEDAILSLNGRSAVFAILVDEVLWQPIGIGFVAGPRLLLSERLDGLPGAHNSYTETWAGAGPIAFLAFLGIFLFLIVRLAHLRAREGLIISTLLAALMLEGMLESNMVFPFVQSSALLWILVALVAGASARERALIQMEAEEEDLSVVST